MTGLTVKDQARLAIAGLPHERVPCPLCGGQALDPVARSDRFGLDVSTVACRSCRFVFTNPRPVEAALTEFYARWYRQLYGHEVTPTARGISIRGLDRRSRATLGVLEHLGLSRSRSLLEVGAGYGCLLRAVGEDRPHMRRVGVEPDAAYARFARDHAGCQVVRYLDELGDAEPFDAIVLVHALEHVSDPVLLLSRLRERLAPGGFLYVDVPDARRYVSLHDLHVGHVSHFTAETLVMAASRAGLCTSFVAPHDPPLNVPSIHAAFRRGQATDAGEAVSRIERLRGVPEPLELFSWLATQPGLDDRPWLVVGKGPTFSRRGEVDLTRYRLLGLNHVCRHLPVEVTHAIDLDVVTDLGQTLLTSTQRLVMPWRPHVNFKPSELTLHDAIAGSTVLRQLAEEGRLYWYNLSTAPEPRSGSPVVQVCFFSGEVAVRALAIAGVRTIRTLGVDGGARYAGEFGDLTPLTNGVRSFDLQTQAIEHTVREFDLNYRALFEVGPAPSRVERGDPLPEARLTVVLVTHDQLESTRDLLEALDGFTRSPCELIVVDNASNDGTLELLRARVGRPGFTLVQNMENARCARATNQALALVRTELVAYLCASHALVTAPGWDDTLVRYMDERPEVALAGDVWNPYGFELPSRRYKAGWSPTSHGRERLSHVQGGAWIARRSVFEQVGGFAEDEYPHGGMDVELSYRLLSYGLVFGAHPGVSCPPAPAEPLQGPGVVVCHPATPAHRERVRARLRSSTLFAPPPPLPSDQPVPE